MFTVVILDSMTDKAPKLYQALSVESARAIGRPVPGETTHIYDENMQHVETMEYATPCCLLTGRPFLPGEKDMAGNVMVPLPA